MINDFRQAIKDMVLENRSLFDFSDEVEQRLLVAANFPIFLHELMAAWAAFVEETKSPLKGIVWANLAMQVHLDESLQTNGVIPFVHFQGNKTPFLMLAYTKSSVGTRTIGKPMRFVLNTEPNVVRLSYDIVNRGSIPKQFSIFFAPFEGRLLGMAS